MSVQQQQFLLSIDRNDRTCSKKKEREKISLRAPFISFRHPAFSPDVSLLSPRFLLSPFPSLPPSLVLPQLSLPPPFLHNFCLPSWGYHHCRKQKRSVYDRLMQTAAKRIHKTIVDAGLQSIHVCLRETRGCGVTCSSVILRDFLKIKKR